MKNRRVLAAVVALGASLALVLVASAARKAPAPVPAFTADQLTAASGNDWIGYNGNAFNHRFSTLNQITRSTRSPGT